VSFIPGVTEVTEEGVVCQRPSLCSGDGRRRTSLRGWGGPWRDFYGLL